LKKAFQKNALKYYNLHAKAITHSVKKELCYDPASMRRNLPIALVASLFFAICFYRAVYVGFDKVSESLAFNEDGPNIQLTIPDHPRAKLLLLELRNFSPFDIAVQVKSENMESKTISVERGEKKLVYFESWKSIHLNSQQGEWMLRRADLRNYYGSHRGPLSYVIVTPSFRDYNAPSLGWSIVVFLIFLFPGAVTPLPKKIGRILWGVAAVFWICILLVPFVSSYKVLFAAKTFFLFVALLYLPGIRAAYSLIRNQVESRWPSRGVAALHTLLAVPVVFLFFFFQMLYSLEEFRGNYSGFLVLSPKWILKNPLLMDREDLTKDLLIAPDQGGYDAQFFYAMTFDPFLQEFSEKPRLYRRVVDAPPYRYGRIGYSLLTKVFSLDFPRLYPVTMVYLILFSHLLAAFFLARMAILYDRSPFWALLYPLIPAFTVSLHVGLPESLSAAFLIAGIYYSIRGRMLPAVLPLAVAILIRETSGVFVLVAISQQLLNKRFRTSAILSLSFLPYVCWRLYVGWRLFPTFGDRAFFFDPEGTVLPFAGVVALYQAIFRGEYIPEMATAAAMFGAFLLFAFFFSLYLFWKRRDFVSAAFFCYSLLAVSLDYQNVLLPILNAERVAYEAFVLLLVAFLTLKDRLIERAICLMFFAVLLYYDWSIFTYSQFFKSGVLWDRLMS
jgi:hypothetical protein